MQGCVAKVGSGGRRFVGFLAKATAAGHSGKPANGMYGTGREQADDEAGRRNEPTGSGKRANVADLYGSNRSKAQRKQRRKRKDDDADAAVDDDDDDDGCQIGFCG